MDFSLATFSGVEDFCDDDADHSQEPQPPLEAHGDPSILDVEEDQGDLDVEIPDIADTDDEIDSDTRQASKCCNLCIYSLLWGSQANPLDLVNGMVLSLLEQLVKTVSPVHSHRLGQEGEEDEDDAPKGSEKPKTKPKICFQLVDRRKPCINGKPAMKSLIFPRSSPKGSSRSIAQLFTILNVVQEALMTGVPVTKRDIYYRDPELFQSQRTVDNFVDDLAATWDLQRSDLNVRASTKGLACGSGLTIRLKSGEEIKVNDTEGTNIPVGEDIETFGVEDDVQYVLIVEKEAVFQTLCRLCITTRLTLGHGIMITGRGYPDVATRHLVKSLADALPARIKFFALVDCDPYGIDILSVYRFGSNAMQHENDTLASARVRWLGVRISDLVERGVPLDSLLPLTNGDEKKINALLSRPNLPGQWRNELTQSLELRRKAEIEILCSVPLVSGSQVKGHPLLVYIEEKLTSLMKRGRQAP